MSFESRGEAVVGVHSQEELKLLYRILHQHLTEHSELMDTHLLIELQSFLQKEAQKEGVDISHHGQWDVWLGNLNAKSCEVQNANRRVINPD